MRIRSDGCIQNTQLWGIPYISWHFHQGYFRQNTSPSTYSGTRVLSINDSIQLPPAVGVKPARRQAWERRIRKLPNMEESVSIPVLAVSQTASASTRTENGMLHNKRD